MPTYDYRCDSCGHEFEHFQSIKARPLRTCPACKRAALQRLIGVGGGILFRGTGFYQTDYRSEAYKKAAEAESKPAGGSGDGKAEKGAKAEPSGQKPVEKRARKKTRAAAD